MHGRGFCFGKGLKDFNSLFSTTTISPFSTSLTNVAPTISKAHVSEANIYELPFFLSLMV